MPNKKKYTPPLIEWVEIYHEHSTNAAPVSTKPQHNESDQATNEQTAHNNDKLATKNNHTNDKFSPKVP